MDKPQPVPFLQVVVDEISRTVQAEVGEDICDEPFRAEVQRRLTAYVQSQEFRDRQVQHERDELRQEAGERSLALLDVLIAHDPGGIVAVGAPSEQYTTEAAPLARRLQCAESRETAALEVARVLDKYFGDWDADIEALSSDIWEAWQAGPDL